MSPVGGVADDDLRVEKRQLKLGDAFVAVVTLKQLPDKTEPGLLVPLLRMARRGRYEVVLRVDIPRTSAELAALRAKATLAAGLRLENFLVKSDRSDPVAKAVERQSDEALDRIIASTQRVFGVSLSITLYEDSPEALDAGVQEVLGVMARAYGMRGYRETYLLKPAWMSTLPGAPVLVERRRKALTPTMVDMLPCFDFRVGRGKVPFTTPNNSLVLYDPFDTAVLANANVLITGTSGAGKSVLAQYLLSGYEIACAGRHQPLPYVFILDNGGSYQRYMELRPEDARYVTFTFQHPPGADVFAWSAEDGGVEEHVSRRHGGDTRRPRLAPRLRARAPAAATCAGSPVWCRPRARPPGGATQAPATLQPGGPRQTRGRRPPRARQRPPRARPGSLDGSRGSAGGRLRPRARRGSVGSSGRPRGECRTGRTR